MISVKGGYRFNCIFFIFVTSELLTEWTDFDDSFFNLKASIARVIPFYLCHFWQWYPSENHMSLKSALSMCETNNSISCQPISMIFPMEKMYPFLHSSLTKVWLGSDYEIRLKLKMLYISDMTRRVVELRHPKLMSGMSN